MTEAPKGTKQLVLGGVLAGLGLLIVLFSRTLGFELDPFYGAIAIAGVVLVLIGTVRKGVDGKRLVAPREAASQEKRRCGS